MTKDFLIFLAFKFIGTWGKKPHNFQGRQALKGTVTGVPANTLTINIYYTNKNKLIK